MKAILNTVAILVVACSLGLVRYLVYIDDGAKFAVMFISMTILIPFSIQRVGDMVERMSTHE